MVIFKIRFKAGANESMLYFGEWMHETIAYNTAYENGNTYYLIRPKNKINNEDLIWLPAKLFDLLDIIC